jgi:hypothetical protein
MRINSSTGQKVLAFIYILSAFSIVFDLIILNIDGSWKGIFKTSPVAIGVILFLIYRGLPSFNYDSDGEVLNFTAKEPNFPWLGSLMITHFEFPKRKLARFKIQKLPFRRKLIVHIHSKAGHIKKQSITISYLTRKELRDLKKSLNGVLTKNKERQDSNGRGTH